MRHRTSRRWALSFGVVVIVAGVLWLALPTVVTSAVRNVLNDAGFANVSITGATLGLHGVEIERVKLAPDDRFVLDDIRMSVTTSRVTRLAIGRLYLEAALGDDAGVVLPGFEPPAPGSRGDVVDFVPEDGIRVDRVELRVASPWHDVLATLDNTQVRRESADVVTVTAGSALATDTTGDAGAAILAIDGMAALTIMRGGMTDFRLDVANGSIEAATLRAEGLTGVATATWTPESPPDVELALDTTDTRFAEMVLGALSFKAGLHDDVVDLTVTSSSSDTADLVVDGRARLTESGPLIDLTGRASFKAPTTGELTLELTGVSLSSASARGRLLIMGNGLGIPGLLHEGAIEAAADIEGNMDQIRLAASSPWTASFVPEHAIVPAAMSGVADRPATVRVQSRTDAPLELRFSWTEAAAELDAAVDARAGRSRVEAAARITADWATELTVQADALSLSAADLPWQSLIVGVDAFEGQAVSRAAAWRVTGAGTVRASGALGELDLSGLTAQWSGTISGTPGNIAATTDECIDWAVGRTVWRSTRIDDLAPPCLRAGEGGLLDYDRARSRVSVAASTAAGPLHVRLAHRAAEGTQEASDVVYAIDGTWPAMRLTAAIDAVHGVDLSVGITDGAMTLAAQDVAIMGLGGAAAISAGALRSWSLSAAAIESLAETPWWAPVTLEASAEREDGALRFEALISDALGTFVLEATGSTRDASARSDVTFYPVQLISGATELSDISPWLAEHVTDATGTVAFDATIEWDSDHLASTGRLSLGGVDATVSGIPVRGVDTQTEFSSLWPLVTQPEQTARIGALSLGMPLENGLVVYELDADGRISIHELSFETAGGRVYSDAFTIDSAAGSDTEFRLVVEDIELARMLELIKINGLQGTGTLSGSMPVRISGQDVYLDDGRLTAATAGTLRYTPSSLPAFLRGDDQRTRMLREALTNFRYDDLSVTVSGDSSEGGEQRVRFDALGSNPDFLGGHPIELAFTFTGPLLGAMSSATNIAGAADIRDLYEQQPLNNSENSQ